jgi:hypothetical protein
MYIFQVISRRLTFSIFCALSVGLAPLSQAEDEKISEIKTVSGTTYQNVKITKVTPSEISIIHESGVARILLKDLPDDLKTKFDYDPNKAEAHARNKKLVEAQTAIQIQKEAENRKAFEQLNFGDSTETIRRKIRASKLLQPINNEFPETGRLSGQFLLSSGVELFPAYFLTLDDKLAEIQFRSFSRNASFYNTDIKNSWQTLRKMVIAKYGEPNKSIGYLDFSSLENGYWKGTDTWSFDQKIIRLGIVEVDSTYHCELHISSKVFLQKVKNSELELEKEAIDKAASGF